MAIELASEDAGRPQAEDIGRKSADFADRLRRAKEVRSQLTLISDPGDWGHQKI